MSLIKSSIRTIMTILIIFTLALPAYGLDFEPEKTFDSVFVIYSGNSMGSGFAIEENLIITNAHVIDSERNIGIKTYSGKTYEARIEAIDYSLDIAVLTVQGMTFKSLAVGDDSEVRIGDDVYTIGAPGDLEYTLTKGIISAKNRAIGDYTYLQIDAAINSGNSGGPLLNSRGEVIGVNTLKAQDKEGIGFSIPINTVMSYLRNEDIDPENATQQEKPSEVPEENPSQVPEGKEVERESDGLSKTYLIYGLSLVIVLAIIVIIIIYRRNRTKKKKIDASERTDFDIDIY